MGFPIADLIEGIFKPAAELVDEMHTSKEEMLDAKTRLLAVQAQVMQTVFSYETANLEAKARIVESEAKSEHFLTACWRPITMLTFVALVVLDAFGIVKWASGKDLSDQMWLLLQIGLGGYVGGRSVEKVADTVLKIRKQGKD